MLFHQPFHFFVILIIGGGWWSVVGGGARWWWVVVGSPWRPREVTEASCRAQILARHAKSSPPPTPPGPLKLRLLGEKVVIRGVWMILRSHMYLWRCLGYVLVRRLQSVGDVFGDVLAMSFMMFWLYFGDAYWV